MLVELLLLQARAEVGVLGHERAPALALDDDAGMLELEVGALDGDHRNPKIDRKCPNRRDFLARLPVADRDAMPDLLHDLEVHGAPVGLRYCEHSVHIDIHSVPNPLGSCKLLSKNARGEAPGTSLARDLRARAPRARGRDGHRRRMEAGSFDHAPAFERDERTTASRASHRRCGPPLSARAVLVRVSLNEEQTELAFRVTVTDLTTFTARPSSKGSGSRGDTIARYDCQPERRAGNSVRVLNPASLLQRRDGDRNRCDRAHAAMHCRLSITAQVD